MPNETTKPVPTGAEEWRTYRVKPGKVWQQFKEGETIDLLPSEAAPYPDELEEVPAEPPVEPTEPTEPEVPA